MKKIFLPHFETLLNNNFKGRHLQVIVKACNYILGPKETYEGTWHVEGMSHENIIASGIYYYNTTGITGRGLGFRMKRPEHWSEVDDNISPTDTSEWSMNNYLGKLPTPPKRCLFFTNNFQHKVELLQNESEEVGFRKILCFFLVNPDIPILSSGNIPIQQRYILESMYIDLLYEAFLQKMPLEVVNHIVKYMTLGMSVKSAKRHRKILMKERKYVITSLNLLWERTFSLCEH